ncbi:MAG: hypothetical protein RL375_4124 [Pseudomonadota bacterium]|jgi:hypothetical protein
MTAAKYRLVVSDQVKFTFRLVMLDGEQERIFPMRLQADRLPSGTTLQDAFTATPAFADFLTQRNVRLLEWQGDSPLRDDQGQPAPADAEALAVLLANQGVARACVDAYVDAIGGKAKLGN